MKGLKWAALACVFGGIALLAYGASTGSTEAGFFLIFPVVIGSGIEAFGGTLLIIAGIFLGLAHMATAYRPEAGEPSPSSQPVESGTTTKTGGVLLLGPIPVVFGSDKKMTTAMLVLAVILTLLLISFFLFVRP